LRSSRSVAASSTSAASVDDLRSSGFDGWVATELDSYDRPAAEAGRESYTFVSG
jgi:hypothetical protein